MNNTLQSLCDEINDWHPDRKILPGGYIPVAGWVRSAPANQPSRVSFLRVGVLANGVFIEARRGVFLTRTKRLLATALHVGEARLCLMPKHKHLYVEETWDAFRLEWEFILLPKNSLDEAANNLSICRSSFLALDQMESTKLIPFRRN